MVLLPISGAVYSIFFFILTVEIIAGESVFSSIIPIELDALPVRALILDTLVGYLNLLSGYGGTLMYFILILILLILILPISITFIAIGTFVYAVKYLLVFIVADLALYLLGSLIPGKTPGKILKRRYKRLFPKSGRRLDEKSYSRWLDRHSEEFDDDSYGKTSRKSPLEEFYEETENDYDNDNTYDNDDDFYESAYSDDNFEDDDYDGYIEASDYYEDSFEKYDRKRFPNIRNRKRSHDLFFKISEDDLDNTDDTDEYDDLRIEDKRKSNREKKQQQSNKPNSVSSFNFFAGCTTLESATKKYKSLVKLYHPDNMDGDTTALQEINVQYNSIKKRLS
ncbi:hypothetical protein [Butyrivibrio sp. AE3004]|uniref:hypothetical protein n=1 Tax=Butyrivibrio sp. AE3004 TaxID=1506994 RepID=UPI000A60712B|nr:hypothetical protein [Butyrivibrio sp. AE3004]